MRPVAPLHVDREPEVHVLVAHDDGLAVFGGERGVEGREVGERAEHRVGDQVGEADLARARARQLVVEDLAVDLEQLGRNHPHRGRGRDTQAGLHVLDRAGGRAAQRLGLVTVEHHRARARRCGGRRGRSRCRRRRRVGRWSRRSRWSRGVAVAGRRGGVREVGAPVVVDRGRVPEVTLVELLHEPGVRAEVVETGHRTSSLHSGRLRCAVRLSGHDSTPPHARACGGGSISDGAARPPGTRGRATGGR